MEAVARKEKVGHGEGGSWSPRGEATEAEIGQIEPPREEEGVLSQGQQ